MQQTNKQTNKQTCMRVRLRGCALFVRARAFQVGAWLQRVYTRCCESGLRSCERVCRCLCMSLYERCARGAPCVGCVKHSPGPRRSSFVVGMISSRILGSHAPSICVLCIRDLCGVHHLDPSYLGLPPHLVRAQIGTLVTRIVAAPRAREWSSHRERVDS